MSTERSSDGLVRIVLVVVAVVVLVPVLMMAVAMPMMGMLGWWWDGGMAGGPSPLWGMGMLLVWLAVLVGVGYLLYRGVIGGSSAATDPALEELRVAYARGDLSDEEFEERRERLTRER